MTMISAREFNQNISGAKRAAQSDPVIITDRGDPAFVLMSYATFKELTSGERITDLLHLNVEVEFEPERIAGELREVDL